MYPILRRGRDASSERSALRNAYIPVNRTLGQASRLPWYIHKASFVLAKVFFTHTHTHTYIYIYTHTFPFCTFQIRTMDIAKTCVVTCVFYLYMCMHRYNHESASPETCLVHLNHVCGGVPGKIREHLIATSAAYIGHVKVHMGVVIKPWNVIPHMTKKVTKDSGLVQTLQADYQTTGWLSGVYLNSNLIDLMRLQHEFEIRGGAPGQSALVDAGGSTGKAYNGTWAERQMCGVLDPSPGPLPEQ